ncbi:MCP four helix bundle domain-containing protein [Aneurinibacillus soli]|uniref:Four helix bundle sensory module for signal transduction n=1 Tax=Aneurinibacillus soli TaxID=1500254 RepID=A0A0U5AVE2_9BACL|nr:MCP four helix bundle domain-containing protein [Aneurinibacillus soli]BAU26162.1 Four helix bundle sensory module for signal transduction [Aneurinibacillus soli]
MKWTIMKKLIGGFSLVLILLVSTSVIAVTKMTGMGSKVDEINATWFPAALLVHDMKIDFINIDRLSLRLTLESKPEEKEQLVIRIQDSLEKLKKEQEQYEKDFLTDPEEKKLYDSKPVD